LLYFYLFICQPKRSQARRLVALLTPKCCANSIFSRSRGVNIMRARQWPCAFAVSAFGPFCLLYCLPNSQCSCAPEGPCAPSTTIDQLTSCACISLPAIGAVAQQWPNCHSKASSLVHLWSLTTPRRAHSSSCHIGALAHRQR
jgi:hypothetical protein